MRFPLYLSHWRAMYRLTMECATVVILCRIVNGNWEFSQRSIIPPVVYWAPAGMLIKASFGMYFAGVSHLGTCMMVMTVCFTSGKTILPSLSVKVFGLPIFYAVASSVALNTTFYPVLVKLHHSYNHHAARVRTLSDVIPQAKKFSDDVTSLNFLKQNTGLFDS